jgi:hypothetical protein
MENKTEIINDEELFNDDLFITTLINSNFEKSFPIINNEINEIFSEKIIPEFDEYTEFEKDFSEKEFNGIMKDNELYNSNINNNINTNIENFKSLIIHNYSENNLILSNNNSDINSVSLSTDLIDNNKNNLKQIAIKKGQKILNKNDFFNDLEYIMSNKLFSSYYKKYFTDFSNIRTIILYMKLYETIQKEYKDKHGYDIEKELLIYIIKELMSNSHSRKNIYDAFYKYCDNMNDSKKIKILDIFDNRSISSIKN